MKYSFFFIFLIHLTIIVSAQNVTSDCYCTTANNEKFFEEKLTGKIYQYHNVNKVEFFGNDWHTGSIQLANGNVIANEQIGYNIKTDELIWLNKSNLIAATIEKDYVKQFGIQMDNGQMANFRKIKIKNWYSSDSVYAYVQVLAEGKMNLYAWWNIVYSSQNNEYANNFFYYIQHGNQKLEGVTFKKKHLLKLVDERKDELKSALGKERNRVKNIEQLTNAVKLYNGLFK